MVTMLNFEELYWENLRQLFYGLPFMTDFQTLLPFKALCLLSVVRA